MKKDPQPVDLPPLDVNRRYSIRDACAYLGISRPWLYAKHRAGDIAFIRDGRRHFVPGAEIAKHCRTPSAT